MGLYLYITVIDSCHVPYLYVQTYIKMQINSVQIVHQLKKKNLSSTQAAWALLVSFLASGSMAVPATSALALALDRSCCSYPSVSW